MAALPPARHRRWWLLPVGAVVGAAAAFLAPGTSGCVYHDTCIKVTSPGHDWCRNVVLARQWPAGGSFEDAALILRPDGAVPRGCRCYNDAEDETLNLHVPECRFLAFVDELEQAARQECESLVMPGHDHNCWTTSGPQASIVEDQFFQGAGSCVGSCEYGPQPAQGSCPTPNPYECATGDDGGGGDDGCSSGGADTGGGESGLDESGSESSGGVMSDFDGLIACDAHRCELDESFVRGLYDDPSPLLAQGARLAVQAYVSLRDADALEVRVKRGTQWLDFTYTFVP